MHPSEIYLKDRFHAVRGMSSKTAAIIACRLMRDQTARGISGPIVEIGVFEGRFFIGLALCTVASEKCVAIDRFDWPDAGIRARFIANCEAAGVDTGRVMVEQAASGELSPAALRKLVNGPVRFMHIDGAHGYDAVCHDLRLAKPSLHVGGILCMDDVLHPQFPELTIAVADFLKSSPDFHLIAIIDRESFAASCKYLICRKKYADDFKASLLEHFPDSVMKQRAPFFGSEALILSPLPG